VARAVSSGWTCTDCGTQRIRTVVTDAAPADERKPPRDVPSRCPGCGHVELVPAEAGERIISIEYGSP
jgi:predicted RNA-binding Zn-ribbon protein involved in translation (DUF1610 family)